MLSLSHVSTLGPKKFPTRLSDSTT
jgi:hypothetical protein